MSRIIRAALSRFLGRTGGAVEVPHDAALARRYGIVLPREHELDEPTKRFISALIWHVGDLSLLNDEAARRELIYKVLASLLVASRQMSEHQLTHLELATGLAHHPALRLGVAVQQPTDESTQALVVMGTDQVSWLVSYTRQREGLVVKAREAEAFDA